MISKQMIINEVASQTNLSKEDAKKSVDAIVEGLNYFISKGESVHILNFGTFELRKQKSKVSFNIHSKEKYLLEERAIPFFKASKTLKNKIKK